MVDRKKHPIHRKLYFWVRKKEIVTLPNFYFGRYEMDLLSLAHRKEMLVEYEIKISLSDYKADFLKSHFENNERVFKHDLIKSGLFSNRFYFVVPEGLLEKKDVPDYCGLIIYKESSGFKTIKSAPILHERTPPISFYKGMVKTMAFREFNLRIRQRNGA